MEQTRPEPIRLDFNLEEDRIKFNKIFEKLKKSKLRILITIVDVIEQTKEPDGTPS